MPSLRPSRTIITRPPCSTTNWRARSPGGDVRYTGASKSATLRSRTPRAADGVAVGWGVTAGEPLPGAGRLPSASSPEPLHATTEMASSITTARVTLAIEMRMAQASVSSPRCGPSTPRAM